MTPRIQAIVTQFVEDLTVAIQEEGAAAFKAAIAGDDGPIPIPYSRGKPGPKPKAAKRSKGAKRSPAEIEALTKNLLAAIKKKPGQRIEEIGKTLGVVTKELSLPVAKLWDTKLIKTTGQKRATKYFPK